jgi:hypothetical protein
MNIDNLVNNNSRHIRFGISNWTVSKWNEDEVSFNPRNIIKEHEKILSENPKTSVLPSKIEHSNNVILTQGLTESAKRDAGLASTAIDYVSLGTSSTAESESQTDLQAELSGSPYVRKQCSTQGARAVVGVVAKYGMLFTTTDVPSASSIPITIKEAGLHWHVSDASKCHARLAFSDFALDAGDLLVIQANETMSNGVL